MSYAVKELFYTLQGEGHNTGRPAVFVRFAGCNLWSGRATDRESAICRFCDTDFVGTDGLGGGRFVDAGALAEAALGVWPRSDEGPRFVVLTGGEPALQVDAALIEALHAAGFEIAIETNGTHALPAGIDWVCVSPKAGTNLVVRGGDELKVVFPQEGLDLTELEALPFRFRCLQPMDGPRRLENTRVCVETCMLRPCWRLSLQTHKVLGIP